VVNCSYRWFKVGIDGEWPGEVAIVLSDKNTGTLSGAMIGVNCAQACEEFP
jgi:hypothetical protein